mmetsp:Transcript_26285/g.87122  ORF Transcript_26285/g.87122 Transcript_26285/m.87122 type:complete len:218 (-) Transcript_26285:609-1262(-)
MSSSNESLQVSCCPSDCSTSGRHLLADGSSLLQQHQAPKRIVGHHHGRCTRSRMRLEHRSRHGADQNRCSAPCGKACRERRVVRVHHFINNACTVFAFCEVSCRRSHFEQLQGGAFGFARQVQPNSARARVPVHCSALPPGELVAHAACGACSDRLLGHLESIHAGLLGLFLPRVLAVGPSPGVLSGRPALRHARCHVGRRREDRLCARGVADGELE